MGSASPTTLSDRLAQAFAARRQAGGAALIPYITAGHPDYAATAGFLAGARDAGADVVELGIPWSDPVADGPVIQRSSHAALRAGATLERTLACLASAGGGVPVVLFTYLNPVLARGPAAFARDAANQGADGLLVVDLPVGADAGVEEALRAGGLPLVRLVAPTTGAPRLRQIAAASEGFVYLIARTGVTGAPSVLTQGVRGRVEQVRAASRLPVAIGFGIGSEQQARDAAALADGVVVGSALVERMEQGGARAALDLVRRLRRAIDGAKAA